MNSQRPQRATTLMAVTLTVALAVSFVATLTRCSHSDNAPPKHNRIVTSMPFVVQAPAHAHRIVYRSTSATMQKTAESATFLSAYAPWDGVGDRPLAVITPGTLGMADHCASSISMRYSAIPTPPTNEFLAKGWDVIVVDYEGLGTPGVHPYLNRMSAGFSTLDAARAALEFRASTAEVDESGEATGTAGVAGTSPVIIFGYSQGGGASAAAAELAADYAPELNIKAVYAGAVPADLASTASHIAGSALAGLVGYAAVGLIATYPDVQPVLNGILNDTGRAFLRDVSEECIGETVEKWAHNDTRSFTIDGAPLGAHLTDPLLADRVEQQKLGNIAPSMPVFVTHNAADDAIPVQPARDMVSSWTRRGADITYIEIDEELGDASHGIAYAQTKNQAFAWLNEKSGQ